MSVENGGWPEAIDLFPRVTKVARAIKSLVTLPESGYRGEHFQPVDCPDEVPPPEMRLPGFDVNGEYQE